MPVERYLAPQSLEEALEVLQERGEDAKVIAGGQSLLVLMREGFLFPKVLVGLRGIDELAGIEVDGGARIRARATHTEVLSHPDIRASWPVLARAEEAVSTVQIRNRGTLCGNIAHAFPTADPPAALLAVDAVVEAAGREGRREIPMEEFITGTFTTALSPEELVTSVMLPPPPEWARYAYVKFAIRPLDFAIVGVATRLVVDESGACTDARIAINGGADRPIRARIAEEAVRGSRLEDEALAEAAEAAAAESDPVEDLDGSVEYKRRAIRAYVHRALAQARAA